MAPNRQCRPYHEDGPARERKDRQGGQGVHAGVRERVHLVHHQRGLREVPAGEAQDGQWRGHTLRHDLARLRELLRGAQDLPFSVPRDPPRKSEQAYRPVRCAWGRRQLGRRRECPAACSEQRSRHGRGQRLGFRLQRPQRERQCRLLGPVPRCVGRVRGLGTYGGRGGDGRKEVLTNKSTNGFRLVGGHVSDVDGTLDLSRNNTSVGPKGWSMASWESIGTANAWMGLSLVGFVIEPQLLTQSIMLAVTSRTGHLTALARMHLYAQPPRQHSPLPPHAPLPEQP